MATTNKKTNILYWIFTGLFSAFMFMSAVPDIMVMQLAVDGFKEMGLTKDLVPFLGVAKALGVIVILIPGFPRLKEWAYAGLVIDLVGAIYLIICTGKSAENWVPVFIPLTLGFLSYAWYHKRIKFKNNIQ
ncbi:MAG: DoxX family protein [Bacteroidia bacterium]